MRAVSEKFHFRARETGYTRLVPHPVQKLTFSLKLVSYDFAVILHKIIDIFFNIYIIFSKISIFFLYRKVI